jgi:hypothetical protein
MEAEEYVFFPRRTEEVVDEVLGMMENAWIEDAAAIRRAAVVAAEVNFILTMMMMMMMMMIGYVVSLEM